MLVQNIEFIQYIGGREGVSWGYHGGIKGVSRKFNVFLKLTIERKNFTLKNRDTPVIPP